MSASKKKRKRVKLECLECGSCFDDHYRRKHEQNIHGGKRIRVKHVGAPNNPFELARSNANFSKQQQLAGKCRAPDKAPLNLEIIISICQEEIKSALLQEALDILNDGTLQGQDAPVQQVSHGRPKRSAEEDLTNEERRVAGCLLQCVYKKVKAVDQTGFPVVDGLMKLYNEGVQDRNYYMATLSAVRHCISIAQQLKQQQPLQKFDDGQTCDLAYEMFECVSEKIDENCGVDSKLNNVGQHQV